MNLIIIGGGKVGYNLAKTLAPRKYRIVIIEKDKEVCMKIVSELNSLGISVINGDGTDINYLQDADIESADTLIAVTGQDQDNLIACQMAKKKFDIKRTIARVNNPKNIAIFKKFGVDSAVSSTAIIADMIEREVDIDISGIKTLMTVKNSKVSINEIVIPDDSYVVNKAIKDLKIPDDCIIISIIRDGKVIIPNGYSKIEAEDTVIAIAKNGNRNELKEYLLSRK